MRLDMLGIFLDTEANGLDSNKHKIIEIAFKIVDLSTGKTCDQFEKIISMSEDDWKKSDASSLEVNGFTWEDIQKGLSSDLVASNIKQIFEKNNVVRGEAVFICQNPSFDRIFFSQLINIDSQEKLKLPYHWLDLASMFWSTAMEKSKNNKDLLPWKTGYTKDKIAKHYKIGSEQTPHRAMNGVDHLIKCYEAVVGFPEKSYATK